MGWGCYKHEVDAGSTAWDAKMGELCDAKLATSPRTWGRDEAICPFCWDEMEATVERLRAACKLALEKCPFPVGAVKAKEALEAVLKEGEGQ